jgi:hypothetical protein
MTSTATLARPQTELLQRRAAHRQMRARLIEKPHPEDATVGTPYYDEELDVAQSPAHHKTVQKLGELLDRVAAWEGLQSLGDNPVWYWDADEDCQRILYPDYALTDAENLGSVTAKSLLLAIEVVTTTHRRKEEKDTIKMRNWNELNAVPEFLLLYPEPDDPRGLIAYRYNKDQVAYENVPLGPRRRFVSQAIDGLVIEELAPDARSVGRKLRVFYRGEEVRDADAADRLALQEARARQQEARAREAADRRVLQEAQARQQEARAREAADRRVLQEAQARQQEARAREAADRRALQEAQARQQEAQAREAAEHHAAAAEQRAREEAQARMAAEQQAQRALALLEKAGIKLD